MKTALVFDSTEEGRGFATDKEGNRIRITEVNTLREIDFSEVEKDPGKAHFPKDQAEDIVRNVRGYHIEPSPYSGFYFVVKDE